MDEEGGVSHDDDEDDGNLKVRPLSRHLGKGAGYTKSPHSKMVSVSNYTLEHLWLDSFISVYQVMVRF